MKLVTEVIMADKVNAIFEYVPVHTPSIFWYKNHPVHRNHYHRPRGSATEPNRYTEFIYHLACYILSARNEIASGYHAQYWLAKIVFEYYNCRFLQKLC